MRRVCDNPANIPECLEWCREAIIVPEARPRPSGEEDPAVREWFIYENDRAVKSFDASVRAEMEYFLMTNKAH
jgi:hypothetical protein